MMCVIYDRILTALGCKFTVVSEHHVALYTYVDMCPCIGSVSDDIKYLGIAWVNIDLTEMPSSGIVLKEPMAYAPDVSL